MELAQGYGVFGREFECECGRTHYVEPREIVYSPDALDLLPEVCERCADGRRAAVLMDARTREAAGDRICAGLAAQGWRIERLVAPDSPSDGMPKCDDATMNLLTEGLGALDLVVGVGSGVLSDLAKWLAFDRGIPCVLCPTAASMNGYASSNIAPTLKGIKSLGYVKPAVAVVADPAVIETAPPELTAAGLGDVIARSASNADWLMSHLLFGDYYCSRAVGLVADLEPLYMDRPEDIRARAPMAVEALFQGLLLTGAAMTIAGVSSPSSGGEHLVSHTLDMMSSLDGVPHDLHGRQVGIGTLIASELYRRVLAIEAPRWRAPATEADEGFWGRLAPLVAKECAAKAERLEQARRDLSAPKAWDALRARLAPLTRSPQSLRDCLARAGAACRAKDIGCDRERLLAALLHAHEIRSRVTILDLARMVGVLPDAAEDVLATVG